MEPYDIDFEEGMQSLQFCAQSATASSMPLDVDAPTKQTLDTVDATQLDGKKKHRPASRTCLYSGLRKAWNRTNGLRFGDRAVKPPSSTASGKRKGTWHRAGCKLGKNFCKKQHVHKNKWILSNVVSKAWAEVGRSTFKSVGLGSTFRVFDIFTGVAMLCQNALSAEMRRVFELPLVRPPMVVVKKNAEKHVLLIVRSHDATPRLVNFGSLGPSVWAWARYLVRRADGPGWKLVDLEHLRAEKGSKIQPKSGVLEFFAQTNQVCWASMDNAGGTAYNTQAMLVPPFVLSRANGSTIFHALEKGSLLLDLAHLKKMDTTLVLIHECLDSCRPNKRKVAGYAAELPANVLYWPQYCSVHLLHLGIVAGYDEAARSG